MDPEPGSELRCYLPCQGQIKIRGLRQVRGPEFLLARLGNDRQGILRSGAPTWET